MSRPLMIAAVTLAAYCLLDLAISAFVSILWRTRAIAPADLPPAVRARRLLQLRLVPSVAATSIALVVVLPVFTIFEPVHENEPAGPVLMILAAAAIIQIVSSAIRAIHSLLVTARVEREWLRSSTALNVGRAIPAFAVTTSSPIVAVVGVFKPKLIAARSILDACTPDEVACIVAHERGHIRSQDNLKRWVMASLPDTLRWFPIHYEMIDAWHHAAEDAADDAATGGEEVARTELAALLLKVVRLAPQPQWASAIVSAFVETGGLERRVRRLIRPELEPPAPLAIVPIVMLAVISITAVVVLLTPALQEPIFEVFEALVAFGR